jgi:hypothetical protein
MNDQQIRDREIRAAFEGRANATPSPELVERISKAARGTRQQRPMRWMPDVAIRIGPRLMWAAVISLLSLSAVGLLLVGGSPDNDLSVQPSPPPSPVLSSPSASPAETPHQAEFSIDDFVQIALPAGVPVRAQPDAASVTLDPYRFAAEMPLLIADGPVSSGGVDWYYVVPAFWGDHVPSGWAPATDASGPVLVPFGVDCPRSPLTAFQLFNLRSYAFLGCYGEGEITVSGAVTCGAGPASLGEDAPSWFRPDRQCVFNSQGDDGAPYPIFGDPAFDLVPADAAEGTAVDGYYAVTGHFDDARCQPSDGNVTDESRPLILRCRTWFIVTAVSPIAGVPSGFAQDIVVRTVVGDLRVRSAPGVSASSQKLEPLLPMGVRLFVVDGPVAADGYDWYQVQPMTFEGEYPFGWVAAVSRDGVAWLGHDELDCPTSPLDAAALRGLGAYGGLACFHGDEIQLAVDLTCEELVGDFEITGPTWLRFDRQCSVDLGTYSIGVNEAGPNLLPLPTAGRMLITGHFDDPQAASCVYGYAPPAPDPAAVVFGCRNQFVATSIVPAP